MEVVVAVIACALSLAALLLAVSRRALTSISARVETLGRDIDRVDRSVHDECRESRRETSDSVQRLSESLVHAQAAVGQAHGQHLETFSTHLSAFSQSAGEQIAQLKSDLNQALEAGVTTTANSIGGISRLTLERVDASAATLTGRMTTLESRTTEELSSVRRESLASAQVLADTLSRGLGETAERQDRRLAELATSQNQQWNGFRAQVDVLRSGVEGKVEALRTAVDQRLTEIREDNAARLEQMRQTVDEKLQSTLEARLGESFRQVSDRLEQVYKGLGEMQALASGVGDLKRVLTNVRARGTWGEVQLGVLLEQVLAPDQYATNVGTGDGGERVEFAIRLPGRSGKENEPVWLPLDSKFPMEDYQALLEASDRADATALDEAARRLEVRVRSCAKDISTKYLEPPQTTDFAIMFLPNEGLYAEVLRRPGLAEFVQREYRIVIAGPTTLWAILTSLQMGFKTLAIERRSSEVWALLGAVKTEFGKFGTVLDGIQKNLNRAATKIDEARKGTRAIQRKLTDVQELPQSEAAVLLDGGVLDPLRDDEQVLT
jgi:DNA recombination protein RmuC